MSENDDKKTDPTALGNVARIFCDEVTGVHVIQARELQKANPSLKIGEAMVQLGSINEDQLQSVVKKQQDMRDGKFTRKDIERLVNYATRKSTSVSQMLVDRIRGLFGRGKNGA